MLGTALTTTGRGEFEDEGTCCACAVININITERKVMADDGREESLGTDDDSDQTGADGSLNNTVRA